MTIARNTLGPATNGCYHFSHTLSRARQLASQPNNDRRRVLGTLLDARIEINLYAVEGERGTDAAEIQVCAICRKSYG